MYRLALLACVVAATYAQYPFNHQQQPQYNNQGTGQGAAQHYVSIGAQLQGDYKFGYDTGSNNGGQSFREESRLPDGTVKGAYGYVDANGRQRIIRYTAGKDGFKAEGDIYQEGAPPGTLPGSQPAAPAAPAAPQHHYTPPVQQPAPYTPPAAHHVPYTPPQAPQHHYTQPQQQYNTGAYNPQQYNTGAYNPQLYNNGAYNPQHHQATPAAASQPAPVSFDPSLFSYNIGHTRRN